MTLRYFFHGVESTMSGVVSQSLAWWKKCLFLVYYFIWLFSSFYSWYFVAFQILDWMDFFSYLHWNVNTFDFIAIANFGVLKVAVNDAQSQSYNCSTSEHLSKCSCRTQMRTKFALIMILMCINIEKHYFIEFIWMVAPELWSKCLHSSMEHIVSINFELKMRNEYLSQEGNEIVSINTEKSFCEWHFRIVFLSDQLSMDTFERFG